MDNVSGIAAELHPKSLLRQSNCRRIRDLHAYALSYVTAYVNEPFIAEDSAIQFQNKKCDDKRNV